MGNGDELEKRPWHAAAEKRPWQAAAAITIVMSVATGIGTFVSSYLLLSVKLKEETDKAAVERRAKGTQLHCEKLQLSAVLASEIDFSSDRGYPNTIHIADYMANGRKIPQNVPNSQIMADQLALERRASELIPFLSEAEAEILNRTTLHHYVLTKLRTSKVPLPPNSSFNANEESAGVRDGAARLAAAYRATCTEAK